jgi:ribulose-5-phosphate 4-epimerase/fuculose-1-phosphate aldolase
MTIAEEIPIRPLPELSRAAEVAILARALYRIGYDDETNNGHITYRCADETFLTVRDGVGWNEACASDIIRIDSTGDTVEGHGIARPPISLHLEFHRARPGSNVTIHNHPKFATLWASAGRTPPAYDQRSAQLADDDIVVYNQYTGGVRFANPGKATVAGIGQSNCALLRNHGVFVAGDSIPQAFTRAANLEWRSRTAWYIQALGTGQVMPEEGHRNVLEYMASVQDTLPNLWEWTVRRELGLTVDVLS